MSPGASRADQDDTNPARTRFWLLRLLITGLNALALLGTSAGLVYAALAYYATKNGAELARATDALFWSGVMIGVSILLAFATQLGRVLLAIEENTRRFGRPIRPRKPRG
ncbi:MAG: hypothetical protein VKP62_00110 [Candidatus Sericytochromatia bacterium]|nr:hypothetical protein [Candidatus Sericytochromatia bacterium]